LGHVVHAGLATHPEKTVVVYSHTDVQNYITEHFSSYNTVCIEQKEQLGTAHAVLACAEEFADFNGSILILSGDVPLLTGELVERFVTSHTSQNNDVTFISAFVDDPQGLGRVVRDDADDEVRAIVEHKDATDVEKKIDEINTGIYIVKSAVLFELLRKIDTNNAQGEFYITDLVAIGLREGHTVGTFTAENAEALGGVNSRLQLSYAEDLYQNSLREYYMEQGVTLMDPQSAFFSYDTKIGRDCTLGPNIQFGKDVRVESNVSIEGNCFFEKTHINHDAKILSYSHLVGAEVGHKAIIGPFARLRPDSDIGDSAKVGSFVEIKKSSLGHKTSAGHLSYIGDATIGNYVNIGAGTIFANYDGANKHKTIIKDHAFIGSGTTLVAPVQVGEHATTAANSIITRSVVKNSLVVSKVNRVDSLDYQRPTKKQSI
jgi:bifunctional UDP-N-acetylglucosamine pyrophosphorylase/glucosamine-1-phosphate N-acetyltransferase